MGRWRGGWKHSPQSGPAHICRAHPCLRAGAEGSWAWGLGRVQAGRLCPQELVCISQTPEPPREKAGGKGQSADPEAAPAVVRGCPFGRPWFPPGSGPGIASPLGLGSLPAQLSKPRPSTSCSLTGSKLKRQRTKPGIPALQALLFLRVSPFLKNTAAELVCASHKLQSWCVTSWKLQVYKTVIHSSYRLYPFSVVIK